MQYCDIRSLMFSAYEGCSFTTTVGMGAQGATRVDSASTLNACLVACIGATNCVAVEYSETLKCWMHTTNDYLNKLAAAETVTVYAFNQCCECTS